MISNYGGPLEAAHIYPHSLNGELKSGSIWDCLEHFWTAQQIQDWKSAFQNASGDPTTEICSNLMSMTPSVHCYWGLGYFALKPIAPPANWDGIELSVEFHWLKISPSSANSKDLTRKPWFPDDDLDVDIHRRPSKRALCSGDIMTFRTEDPISMPLPDYQILLLQWHLNRAVALTGAAGIFDDDDDDDDDDDWEQYRRRLAPINFSDDDDDDEQYCATPSPINLPA
jgi:hypothetical protein